MNNNILFVAAAGSGKTDRLVGDALKKEGSVLITTFTEANEREIRDRITKKKGCIPSNITIQTWFSFLLQHGVRPYQSVLDDCIHDSSIGFFLTPSKSGVKIDTEGCPIVNRKGFKLYWGEEQFQKYYFTSTKKIYSDKISKFVISTNKCSGGEVVSRVSRIYEHIYIDEVQDLVGYDLDFLKLLFKSDSSVFLVGDPRQVTYHTHFSGKHKKYLEGDTKGFVENELGSRIQCEVDVDTLGVSHRNNQLICDYSARLYTNYPAPKECGCIGCGSDDPHQGVFVVKPEEVETYLEKYSPVQLRWNASSKVDPRFSVANFGESKGATMDRVLIYATEPMRGWVRDNSSELKPEARAKLYVGLTRTRLSSAIIMDYEPGESFPGLSAELSV